MAPRTGEVADGKTETGFAKVSFEFLVLSFELNDAAIKN
jgi:hypothetical protein